MKVEQKDSQQLLEELAALRQQVSDLQRSEARWRSALENAPLFVALADRAGGLRYINRVQPGLSKEEVLQKSIWDYMHPSFQDQARASLALAFEEGRSSSFEAIGAALTAKRRGTRSTSAPSKRIAGSWP